MPQYRPEHRERVEYLDVHGNYEDSSFHCLPQGVPRMGPPMKIVQLADEVVLLYGAGNVFRVAPTDGRPHDPVASLDRTYMGDSVGTWEGDTLVVDVVGFNEETWLGWPGWFHSADMRVEERFRRLGSGVRGHCLRGGLHASLFSCALAKFALETDSWSQWSGPLVLNGLGSIDAPAAPGSGEKEEMDDMWMGEATVKPVEKPANGESSTPATPQAAPTPIGAAKLHQQSAREVVPIARSLLIKGELSGSQDMTVEGFVDGTLDLCQNVLTVGPTGKITAQVFARAVIVMGKVDGSITASEKVEICEGGSVHGDVVSPRVAIADGADFCGSVDMQTKDARSDSVRILRAS